ncbi:MAG: YggT family protein [Gammaproteobacteria bacterium]|nr:YggT family protein [Gammaproteobacteria bacterium]
MGNSYVSNAGIFLVHTIFGLLLLVFMLRLLMQLVRADFHNPVSQFIVKVTNPVLRPLRRFIPGLFGIDMASVLVLIVLQYLELFLTMVLLGAQASPLATLAVSVVELLDFTLKIFLFSLIIQVILSWVNPQTYNPVVGVLYALNEPLLRPARRMLPPISGFDLSPLIVVVFLQLTNFLVVAPLFDFAKSLS